MAAVTSSPARAAFTALVAAHGDELPLDRAAALVAAEERGVSVEDQLDELDRLAASVRLPPDPDPFDAVARLNHRLFSELGFAGDTEEYDAPRNSMLDRVLARRRGLPILLSIIYAEVARRRGVRIEPVGFPAHFVVAVADAEPRFFVDPFHSGQVLHREAMRERLQRMSRAPIGDAELDRHLTRTSPRDVMIRVHLNLKRAFLYRADVASALRATERLIVLAPRPEEHRDRGLLLLHLARFAEAAVELDRYLRARPGARDVAEVRTAYEDALAGRRRGDV
jgi:regulator of sirC expression with transglutaminase-like and TPR domain